eukprot:CAMPEP_0198240300 /NCGR_PEP_ID=MMETSP1446-20131203/5464_1 /TAXON_ID=1461542 ORGANISM="Unidentified sp, Strain CCMP2111" /NCGR_SAMPLE_ID=MMETSP1446 /ASSEMBLY_ACC=CAM_ASM_001112 /LENGTH=765 /DNA_ID=CAMNT_0043923019 /DNA_START=238 /DNA_END=2535 /DNA_ORIENTATION=-
MGTGGAGMGKGRVRLHPRGDALALACPYREEKRRPACGRASSGRERKREKMLGRGRRAACRCSSEDAPFNNNNDKVGDGDARRTFRKLYNVEMPPGEGDAKDGAGVERAEWEREAPGLSSVAASSPSRGWFPPDWPAWRAYMAQCHEAEADLAALDGALDAAVAREDYATASTLASERRDLLASRPDAVGDAFAELARLVHAERFADAARLRDGARTHIEGWWVGSCEAAPSTAGDPYGHVVAVTRAYSRYVGRGFCAQELVQLCHDHAARTNGSRRAKPTAAPHNRTQSRDGSDGERKTDDAGRPRKKQFSPKRLGPPAWDAWDPRVDESTVGEKLWELFVRAGERGDDATAFRHMLVSYSILVEEADQDLRDEDLERVLEKLASHVDPDPAATVAGIWAGADARDILRRADEDEDEDAAPQGPLSRHPGGDAQAHTSDNVREIEEVEELEESPRPSELIIAGPDAFKVVWHHPRVDFLDTAKGKPKPKAKGKAKGKEALRSQPRVSEDVGTLVRAGAGSAYGDIVTALTRLVKTASDRLSGTGAHPDAAEEAEGTGAVALHEDDGLLREDDAADAEAPLVMRYERLHLDQFPKTDVLSGIYYGSFGLHGMEVLSLQRQILYDDEVDSEGGQDAAAPYGAVSGAGARVDRGGSEYVVARKLTGDPNVPAGEVSFKARVGPGAKLPIAQDGFPEELGILARYKGKGRMAKESFSDPVWVDGELLELSTSSPIGMGAQLAFVWAAPSEQKVLILLQKLQLPSVEDL